MGLNCFFCSSESDTLLFRSRRARQDENDVSQNAAKSVGRRRRGEILSRVGETICTPFDSRDLARKKTRTQDDPHAMLVHEAIKDDSLRRIERERFLEREN